MPLIFLLTLRTIDKLSVRDGLLLAFVISQQIIIGHPQYVFITMIGIVCLVFYCLLTKKEKLIDKFKRVFLLALAVFLGIGMASVKIFPFYEFKNISVRSQGLSFNETTTQSFLPKFFLTLIYPFVFGNPANGSYQLFKNGLDIFWEKAGYIGIIPLLLVFFGIFNKEKKSSYEKALIFLLIVSLLLVLGRYSPIFFVYFFPPFNFFQIPARFLILLIFSLSVLAGYGLEILPLKKVNRSALIFLLIVFSFASSMFILNLYHPTVAVKDFLKSPESANFLKGKTGRIYQLGASWPYIKQLQTQGWQDISYYLYAKNSLDADINILYGLVQTGVYDALLTKRQKLIQSLLVNEAKGNLVNLTAVSSLLHKKILNLTSTRYLISPFQFSDPDLKLIKKISPAKDKDWDPFCIYENKGYLPRIRFVNNYQVVKDEEEALKVMSSEKFNPETTAVVEGNLVGKTFGLSSNKINLIKDTDEELIFNVKNDKDGLLIVADSFYPGWQALVDGRQTTIYPANINQRAIFVKDGDHQIKLDFLPQSFVIGKKITSFFYLLWFIGLTVTIVVDRVRPGSKDGNG